MMLNSFNASISLVRSHVNLQACMSAVGPLFPPGETACVFIRQEILNSRRLFY